MHRFLKEYFHFSPTELRAGYIIVFVFLGTILFKIYLNNKTIPAKEIDPVDLIEVYDFIARIQYNREYIGIESFSPDQQKAGLQPVEFDPNNISSEKLKEIGLDDFVVNNWIKYRESGGEFKTENDISRIYGLSKEHFEDLKPYIRIQKKRSLSSGTFIIKESKAENSEEKISIELNTASVEDLIRIRGIGKVYAQRIINYRNLLGGFYSVNQLNEVYGLSDTIIERNYHLFCIDTFRIGKLDLSKASFSELLRHPYLSKNDVRKIVQLRESFPEEINADNLLESNFLEDSILNKVIFYFR